MKKICSLLAYAFLFLLLSSVCLAEEAANLTGRCEYIAAPGSQGRKAELLDDTYLTACTGKYLEIVTPAGEPCYGLYLCFSGRETPFRVEGWQDGLWVTLAEDSRLYANSYVPLPGAERLRVVPVNAEKISIAKIAVLGQGDLPAWVQDWRPFEGKADLLVLSAHADDELLFFGGVIPYYATEQQKHVAVCYLTDQTSTRRNELLDGLWLCGIREYPKMGVFKDIKVDSLADCYQYWGEKNVVDHVTGLLREFRPDVVVTHDLRGEYGHGAHRVCADAMRQAVESAADAAYEPKLGAPWQVQKLYLHLYKENALTLDWRQPLSAFDGQTAFDVAKAAFACHASQRSNGLIVQDLGEYANNRFGLYFTNVGWDEQKNDLFEHVESQRQDDFYESEKK